MPIAFFLAMMLYQAAPSEAPTASQSAEAPAEASAAPNDIDAAGAASNLPKDDYGLVAWCHGALAGQLELDPIAHADMTSIEGKAKVAARAKSDAEMEKDRREYLHEYERALAAAEKASPTAIHQYGVESELAGYKLWGATRQKQPIWRMLDWGMWDPNDAGCGEAAKRLYNKSTLFGEALKGPAYETTAETKQEGEAALPPAFGEHAMAPSTTGGDVKAPVETSGTAPTALGAETAAQAPVADAPDTAPTSPPVVAKPKTVRSRGTAAKSKTAKVVAAPVQTTAPETPMASPADAAATAPSPDPAPAGPPGDNPLRGPQS